MNDRGQGEIKEDSEILYFLSQKHNLCVKFYIIDKIDDIDDSLKDPKSVKEFGNKDSDGNQETQILLCKYKKFYFSIFEKVKINKSDTVIQI
jgi:hypothetical protein